MKYAKANAVFSPSLNEKPNLDFFLPVTVNVIVMLSLDFDLSLSMMK